MIRNTNTLTMRLLLNYSPCIFLLFLFIACKQKPVTNPDDYSVYLQAGKEKAQLPFIDNEMAFWNNRLNKTPDDLVALSKMAGLLTSRFSYSGDIHEIHRADSLYKIVHAVRRTISSGTYRSLAANCITQHTFQQAQLYIDSALELGDDKYLTVLMEFDVSLELGNYARARKALNSLTNKNGFDYLIREAKYKDHVEGNLEAAITLMEKAYEEIKYNPDGPLYLWTKSNLGDMYGHANRYEDSYQCYLDVLEKDPEYYHALKGIAWLAFSHDNDVINAKKILYYLQQQHPVPDYDLLLAEIAGYEQDAMVKLQHLDRFMATVQQPQYGDMYNKYLFTLQTDEFSNAFKALSIAEKEIQNRPTPEAFSWLARAYCETGEVDKAMYTARLYVENKCHEPEALYNLGMIYKAAGYKNNARKYLKQAKESAYELGPLTTAQIREVLTNL